MTIKNQSAVTGAGKAKAKASMVKRAKKAQTSSAADTFRGGAVDETGAKRVAPVMVYLSEEERRAFKKLAFEREESMSSLARAWILEHLN